MKFIPKEREVHKASTFAGNFKFAHSFNRYLISAY